MLHKCRDAAGRITYSDTACQAPPMAPTSPPKPQPLLQKVTGGRLTEAAVEKVLRHAAELGMQSDYEAQCALAAADVTFKLTDTTSGETQSGGRRELCSLQRQSAQAIVGNGMRPLIRLGTIKIALSADGTSATATYPSTSSITQAGKTVMVVQCAREEVLGLYSGDIRYARVNAVCRTTG